MGYLKVVYSHIGNPDYLSTKIEAWIEKFPEPDRSYLAMEAKCFKLLLTDGDLEPFFQVGDYKDTNISLLTDHEVSYIKGRLETETESFLISRYAHVLFKKLRDNRLAKKAIPAYRDLALNYLGQLPTEDKNILDFINVVKAYAMLSFAVKHEIDNCREQVLTWYNLEHQDLFYYQMFLGLFAESKLFQQKHLAGHTDTAISHISADTKNSYLEDYLKVCLAVAQKEGIELKPVYLLMAENQLGIAADHRDDTSGIIAANCYLGASHYYKLANERDKSNAVLRDLQEHKKNIKLSQVRVRMSAKNSKILTDSIVEIASAMLRSHQTTVLLGIAISQGLMPDLEAYKPDLQNDFLNMCKLSVYDINGNTQILNEFEKKRRDSFIYVQSGLELTIPLLFKEIVKQMLTMNRDFVKEGFEYFEKTWFQSEISQFILSEDPRPFRWMTSLKPALELLLKINVKSEGYILRVEEQMAFDQLSVKFEGLFRDLCVIAEITTTKVRENQTVAMDINELLQSKELAKSFDRKDVDLWQYTFTGCGYNIRNNVAHAFYRENDYTVKMSNLLLFAYIKLAKYGSIIKNAQDRNSE
jgi:hypothetical protein